MKKSSFLRSFGHAFDGIGATIASERNMKIHVTAAVLVVLAGLFFGLSWEEWFACGIVIALVLAFELINTALEATVDLVTEERRPLAKKAKDAAAGAVLVVSLASVAVGVRIFLPRLLSLLPLGFLE